VFTEHVTDPPHARGVESAMTGLIASLASWGVVAGHWLPDRDGLPALWVTTQTEAQRRALERAPWLEAQVAILLTRAEVPYEVLKRIRVLVDSEEGHRLLLRDDD
jgi:hypothetical protein